VTSLEALGVSAGVLLKTVKTEPPAQRQKGVMVKDVAELVAVLKRRVCSNAQGTDRRRTRRKNAESATAKCVTCARRHFRTGEITIVLLGADTSGVAAQARSLAGVKSVLRVDRPENEHPLAAIFPHRNWRRSPPNTTHLFGPSTSFGKDLMPRVAALLGAPQVSDLMAVRGSLSFQAPHLTQGTPS